MCEYNINICYILYLSFFLSISLTNFGFAVPPETFIDWPTKKPNNLSLPDLYSATLSLFSSKILSINTSNSLGSLFCF